MKEFQFEYISDIPEQPSIRFYSSGSQGGDSGHGGSAVLEFRMESGDGLYVSTEEGEALMNTDEKVFIHVCGDWELQGLAIALLKLGRALQARNDVLQTERDWEPEQSPSPTPPWVR